MTFAPGWVQIIDPTSEKQDLLSYISDTHKSVYGFRPRGWETGSWSIEDLRAEAKRTKDKTRLKELYQQAAMDLLHTIATLEPGPDKKQKL